MKTLVTTTTIKEIRGHNFKNGWAYIEVWINNILNDNYFVETQYMFPDGSVKRKGRKYFYSNSSDYPEKIVKTINYLKFDSFDKLFFFENDGRIANINGEEIC